MKIKRCCSTPSTQSPADGFIGKGRIAALFQGTASTHISGGIVTFKPVTLSAFLFVLLAACSASLNASQAAPNGNAGSEVAPAQQGGHRVNINIAIGSTNLAATLDDNPTARDFTALLPLTVTLRDFSAAEKVSGALPRRLSEEGATATAAGAVGDIAYYAPWGNIAFYRGRGPDASGVIKIAKITSGIEALNQLGELRVTISRAN